MPVPLDGAVEEFRNSANRNHRPTRIDHEGLLVGEIHQLSIQSDLNGPVAVIVQVNSVSVSDELVLVLGRPLTEGSRFHGAGESDILGFLGEDGLQGGVGVDKELTTIGVNVGIINFLAIYEDLRTGTGGIGNGGRIRQSRRERRGVGTGAVRTGGVEIQGAVALGPAVTEIFGPIGHDQIRGETGPFPHFLREDLAHVSFAFHTDFVVAVNVGVDVADLDVVHIDGGGTGIQMDVEGAGGSRDETDQHKDCHQAGQKPHFFHDFFLQSKMCVVWYRGAWVLAIYVNA